jgi:hypothetical protein
MLTEWQLYLVKTIIFPRKLQSKMLHPAKQLQQIIHIIRYDLWKLYNCTNGKKAVLYKKVGAMHKQILQGGNT